MTTAKRTSSDEARIREAIDNRAKALRVKDIKGVMSHYAADLLTFDLAPPLEYVGSDSLRKNLEDWFPTFRGPIGYGISDLHIDVSQDLALCRSLNRITGTRTGGEKTDVWVRATVGLRKIDGKWLIAHEHVSVPFYMDGSYKAAVDLRP